MDHPERILLIRPSALGDVARTVPVLGTLRRRFPEARIDWLVQDTFADAVRHHPALDRVIPFDRRGMGRAFVSGRPGSTLGFLRGLARARYDLVIDAQGLARSGVFALATLAPTRVGPADARELAWLAYTRRVRTPAGAHTVDRMLALARAAGAEPADDPTADAALHADPAELARADADLAGRAPVVLAATSRWPAKRWPAGRWADLARRLLARGHGPIVALGGPGERPQCAPLLELADADPRVRDAVGTTTVAGMMALIARAELVVANDSAAAHIAVGFGRPLVALYGPTDTARVGPYRRPHDVIQHARPARPGAHKDPAAVRAMHAIGLEEVVAASLARLERRRG